MKDDKELTKEMSLQISVQNNLLQFLNAIVERANSKNELLDEAESVALQKLRDEDEVKNIRISEITRLIEVLKKTDNDFIIGVISGFKDNKLIVERRPESNDSYDLNKEDMAIAKQVFDIVKTYKDKNLEITEMSQEEIEIKEKNEKNLGDKKNFY